MVKLKSLVSLGKYGDIVFRLSGQHSPPRVVNIQVDFTFRFLHTCGGHLRVIGIRNGQE